MQKILLGVDIGTSACKVAAFEANGNVLAQANESYKVYYPKSGWAEQNPSDWWAAVCVALKNVLAKIDTADIAGIGVDGQSWSAIPIGENGEVLCNTPIWMDTRAAEICEQMKKNIGEERLFSVSKNPVQPMYSMPKVLWYKQNLQGVYNKAHKILQANSYIAYMLTGRFSQDKSQGYGFNCYNMQKNEWDYALCEELGVKTSLLPDIFDCHSVVGHVTKKAAEQTGLKQGTPVVAGGLDAACGTLGAGVIKSGQTQEQGGQAGGMSICTADCIADKRLILGAHVVPNLWLLQGGTVGGGGALNWFEREFAESERKTAKQNGTNSFAEIDEIAAKIKSGSEGLLFLPYLAGERSPIWDANAKGVFYGIDFSKTRAHFARAVMEGVAYSLLHNLQTAKSAGASAKTLHAMGGAANSRLWTQIKADVTGCAINVPSSDTATALGAAILAGVGTNVYGSFEEAVSQTVQIKRTHTPNEENKNVYENGYKNYLKLYENLKGMMSETQP